MLASCNKEAIEQTETENFPLSILSASLSVIITKSGSTITDGGKIGVFQNTTTNGYTAKNNVEYDYISTDSKWIVMPTGNEIYLSNKNASVCAYYPYNTAITNATSVVLTSQPYTMANDLSFNTNTTVNNTNSSVNLTMNHAYSQITFKIRKDATYTGTGAISNIIISNTGILTSNVLNITNGTYGKGIAGTVSYNPAIISMPAYDATNGTTITATTSLTNVLMVPVSTAMTTNVALSFVVDGITLNTSIPMASLPQLVAGMNYNITVMILGTKLAINNVTVTDWLSVDAATVYPQ